MESMCFCRTLAFLMAWISAAGSAFSQDHPARIFTNSIGILMVFIPSGSLVLGSDYGLPDRQEDEAPHPVTLGKSFFLSSTEITQGQWRAVMSSDKSFFKGDSLPMERTSWHDAVAFCDKLSQMEGRKYRLPTEAEWEYACRSAGMACTEAPLADQAWYSANSEQTSHAVARKKPNGLGLYDMLGNVAEWCSDLYDADYPAEPTTDPFGAEKGIYRVMRGGSWASFAKACRCASRSCAPAAYQLKQTGFRIALEQAQ